MNTKLALMPLLSILYVGENVDWQRNQSYTLNHIRRQRTATNFGEILHRLWILFAIDYVNSSTGVVPKNGFIKVLNQRNLTTKLIIHILHYMRVYIKIFEAV